MVYGYDIRTANFEEMRLTKEMAVVHVMKYGGGCTRSSLGRIKTEDEFEADKSRILGRI